MNIPITLQKSATLCDQISAAVLILVIFVISVLTLISKQPASTLVSASIVYDKNKNTAEDFHITC